MQRTWADTFPARPRSLHGDPLACAAKRKGPAPLPVPSDARRFTGEGTMVDSSIFDIDWIIVSVVIGLLVALIGAFLYPRRDHD